MSLRKGTLVLQHKVENANLSEVNVVPSPQKKKLFEQCKLVLI